MDGEIKLRFFNHIIWIDPNKAIRTEASHLIWMFGPALEVFEKPSDALQFIQQRNKSNILILCASREVESCYRTFKDLSNIYQRYIVFCGTRHRATQIKSFSPFRDAIKDAFWEIGDLISGISGLEEELIQQPQLMSIKIDIIECKPPVAKKTAQEIQSEKKKAEQKEALKKQEEKKEEKEQTEQGEKTVGDKVEENGDKVEQQGEIELGSKLKENMRIIWVQQKVNGDEEKKPDVEEMQKKMQQRMRKKGFPVYKYDSSQNLGYLVQWQLEQNYYLISRVGIDIEDLKSNTNLLELTIRVGKENERDGLAEEESFATSVEQIITLLEEHIASKE